MNYRCNVFSSDVTGFNPEFGVCIQEAFLSMSPFPKHLPWDLKRGCLPTSGQGPRLWERQQCSLDVVRTMAVAPGPGPRAHCSAACRRPEREGPGQRSRAEGHPGPLQVAVGSCAFVGSPGGGALEVALGLALREAGRGGVSARDRARDPWGIAACHDDIKPTGSGTPNRVSC